MKLLILAGNPAARRLRIDRYSFTSPSCYLRAELARVLWHYVQNGGRLQGAADHLVSEALYLADPEGNGIELYRDRPREDWVRDAGGFAWPPIRWMSKRLLAEIEDPDAPWAGLPEGTRMGHVHLRVADIPSAERFYHDVLGFDITARYGDSASFFAQAIIITTSPPICGVAPALRHPRPALRDCIVRCEHCRTRPN